MSVSLLRRWSKRFRIQDNSEPRLDGGKETPVSTSSDSSHSKIEEITAVDGRKHLVRPVREPLPQTQHQLLLHEAKQPFQLDTTAVIPTSKIPSELLIRIESIGLNPIDWKSAAYGYGLPSLPCVLGRDYVGTIVKASSKSHGTDPQSQQIRDKIAVGSVVLSISTDYRDYRKAAFQQYAIATEYNVCRVPSFLSNVASLLPAIGVAFVTAALSLGVCLGVDFTTAHDVPGPDLYSIVHSLDTSSLPEDIRHDCFDAMPLNERASRGDWIVVWGAASTVGFLTVQLAKRAGLRVVAVADLTKNGSKLVDLGADVLVHRSDPDEAVRVIRSLTEGQTLRYGIDSVGKETAALLQNTLLPALDEKLPNAHPTTRPHLVCLVGSPKPPHGQVSYHKLPMKLFHESPPIGRALMRWLEDLLSLEHGLILPNIELYQSKGLQHVNEALERLKNEEVDGQRLVVEI